MPRARQSPEMPGDPLDQMLARLKLSGIRDQLDSLLDEAARSNLSTREKLLLLCEREIARKDHRRIVPEARLRHEMALKLAHFPAVKELAGFDFDAQPAIDPKQIRDLAASRWIANGLYRCSSGNEAEGAARAVTVDSAPGQIIPPCALAAIVVSSRLRFRGSSPLVAG